MKQRMVVIISVVVGLAACLLTVEFLHASRAALAKERESLYAGARQVDVLVAGKDMPAGIILAKKDLKAKAFNARDVSNDMLSPDRVDDIVGKKLKYSLTQGDALLWSYVDLPNRPGSGLAPMIGSGLRAVSVTVGGAAAVSGLVQPNDKVDVLGSFNFPSKAKPGEMEAVTLTVLQDVTVLATGQQLGKALEFGERGRAASGYNTVTFEVTPREAELLVFVENMKGHLTLALRNPADVSYETDLPSVDFETVEKELPTLNTYRQEVIRHKTKR